MINNSSHYRGNIWKNKIKWERLGPGEEYAPQRFLLLQHISKTPFMSANWALLRMWLVSTVLE